MLSALYPAAAAEGRRTHMRKVSSSCSWPSLLCPYGKPGLARVSQEPLFFLRAHDLSHEGPGQFGKGGRLHLLTSIHPSSTVTDKTRLSACDFGSHRDLEVNVTYRLCSPLWSRQRGGRGKPRFILHGFSFCKINMARLRASHRYNHGRPVKLDTHDGGRAIGHGTDQRRAIRIADLGEVRAMENRTQNGMRSNKTNPLFSISFLTENRRSDAEKPPALPLP